MMVMTAKVNKKKILLIILAAGALILSLFLLMGDSSADATATAVPSVSHNDGRVQFLTDFGWDVTTSPRESGQVKIPESNGEVFDRYNALQKSQGYDLSAYAGKNVMRYVYQINNYPGATEPVYATLLIHKNKVIGGDVTDTAPNGRIQGFKMPETGTAPTLPAVTAAPTEPATPEPVQ